MGYQITVSKEGVNVLGTAGTVLNNLIYHSDYNTLKYHIDGTFNLAMTLAMEKVFPEPVTPRRV